MSKAAEDKQFQFKRVIVETVEGSYLNRLYGGGAPDAAHLAAIDTLPTDTRYQQPLRDATGARIYPTGYLPAGAAPAGMG